MGSTPETIGDQHELVIERMDVRRTATVLGVMVTYLEAEEAVRHAQGAKEESRLLKTVRAERLRLSELIDSSKPGAREQFLAEHQPRLDVLDGVYDCTSADCPTAGYESPEERVLHHTMWGFDNPLLDVRRTIPEQS